jgi:hypothetical protein
MLPTEFESLYERLVPLFIPALQIVQKAPARTHHLDQPIAGAVILAVDFQMLREVFHPPRQKGDLYLAGTRILLVSLILFSNRFFGCFIHEWITFVLIVLTVGGGYYNPSDLPCKAIFLPVWKSLRRIVKSRHAV